MFNATFYPTSKEVAREMLRDVKYEFGTLILDPQGGKGDLLDYMKEHFARGYRDAQVLYTCEIQPELVAILEDKGYPVLARDFLTYKPTMYFSLIIMNPPFDHCEEHIFHAFEILGHGQVVSLIPSSSLEGKNSKELLLLSMIEKHGSVRDLGPVFRHAERPTPENISLVTLTKAEDPFNLDFDPVNERSFDMDFSTGPDQELAVPGFVPALVAQYNAAFGAVEKYLEARVKIEKYAFHGHKDEDPISGLDSGTLQNRLNAFTERMNMIAWAQVLDNPQFQNILTERARKMVEKFRTRQKHLDFNVENIIAMFQQIQMMAPDLLEAAIDDAFDYLTKYHKENREHIEGWSTNLAWKVAAKAILPMAVNWTYQPKDVEINYSSRDAINDIDRAMCVVAQLPFSEIVTIEKAVKGIRFGELAESTFFRLRAYRKGTLHMTFKNAEILKEFNYRAVKNKGWLPDGTQSRFKI